MVLVDVFFSNGTQRLDLSQAAIDFYRKQGVRVELVDPPKFGILFNISAGVYSIVNNRIVGESIIATAKADIGLSDKFTSFILATAILKDGVIIGSKFNTISFSKTERDERITIDESARGHTSLTLKQVVWVSQATQDEVSLTKTIPVTGVTPPDETKECDCNGVIKVIPKFERCPECNGNGNGNGDDTRTLGTFDQIVMGALILGAVLPLGSRKK